METSVPAPEVQLPHSPAYIAPWWHTVLLVLFLLSFSALGAAGHQGLDHALRMKLYISTVIVEWLMLLFIIWGLRRKQQTTLGGLIGGRWKTPEDFLLDVAIAFGFWIVAALVLLGVGYLVGANNMSQVKDMQQRVGSMLPSGRTEILTWLLVCVTAGICEEVIFRGYFQKQFGLLLKSAWGGIVAQALIFGGSHAYEGWQKMVQIAVFGFLFGVLAWWRKSLRPGMMTHFAQDSVAGILGRWALEHATKALPK
jgi:CAAX protease family protein